MAGRGGVWADRWGIQLRSKPKGSHAHVIDRRSKLLRQQCHRIRSQAAQVGIKVSPVELLDEFLLACNTVLAVHGTSPYEALLGRASVFSLMFMMLPDLSTLVSTLIPRVPYQSTAAAPSSQPTNCCHPHVPVRYVDGARLTADTKIQRFSGALLREIGVCAAKQISSVGGLSACSLAHKAGVKMDIMK